MSSYGQVFIVYLLFNIPTVFFQILFMAAKKELKEIIEMKYSTSHNDNNFYNLNNIESSYSKKINKLRNQSFWLANIYCVIALFAIVSP